MFCSNPHCIGVYHNPLLNNELVSPSFYTWILFFLICWWKELALCCLQYTQKLGSIYVGLYIDKNILLIYPRTSQTDKATYFGASFKQYHIKIIHTDSGWQTYYFIIFESHFRLVKYLTLLRPKYWKPIGRVFIGTQTSHKIRKFWDICSSVKKEVLVIVPSHWWVQSFCPIKGKRRNYRLDIFFSSFCKSII